MKICPVGAELFQADRRTYKGNFVTAHKNGPVTATIDLLLRIIIIIIIITSISAPKTTPLCIQNLPKSLNPKVNGLDHKDEKRMTPYLHYHFTNSCHGVWHKSKPSEHTDPYRS